MVNRMASLCLMAVVVSALIVPANLAAAPASQGAGFEGLLAFPVFDTTAERQQYSIFTYDLSTGERKLLLENASQPAFSHDGKSIAYKLWTEDQLVYGLHSAQLSDIAGTDWRFSSSLAAQQPRWAPNDSFFYFHSRHESDRLDRVMVTQGTQATAILRPDMDNKELLGRTPAVVTTGQGFAVLYQGCEYANCGVWSRLLNGTAPTQITQDPSDQALASSPDGRWVAFMSFERDGAKDWEVYVMAADGSKIKRLTNRPGIDGIPTWSSDGNWIAFARETSGGSNNWEIAAIRSDGTGEQKLVDIGPLHGQVRGATTDQSTGWLEEQFSWWGGGPGGAATAVPEGTPTGPRIATPVATGAAPAEEPSAAPTEAPPAAATPTQPAEATAVDRNAAGGGFIVYPAFDPARSVPDIMLMDLSTMQSRRLIEGASQPSLSGDGTWVAYKGWGADRRQQGLHAAAIPDVPGTDWQFTPFAEAQRPVWAPGDLFFAFHSRQESDRQDRIMITKGAQPSTIQRPDMDNKDVLGKTPTVFMDPAGDYVMYQGCEGEGKCGVWRRDLSGGQPKQITEDATDQAFAQSPSGQWVAFMSQSREGANDWELYVMAADGSGVKRLSNRPGIDGLPAWSPDGQWIAFVRETQPGSNAWEVAAIRPDGSGESKLFELGALDGRPAGATTEQSSGWMEEQISWGAVIPTE